MINFIFFIIFGCTFATGISMLQYSVVANSNIPWGIIIIGFLGMMTTIRETIWEFKYGSGIIDSELCRKCIWAEPVIKDSQLKGYLCKKNPIRYIFMEINDKHRDRKYRKKRAK